MPESLIEKIASRLNCPSSVNGCEHCFRKAAEILGVVDAHRTPDRITRQSEGDNATIEAALLKQALKACAGMEDIEDCLRESLTVYRNHFAESKAE
ncbi:MAG: hypothetical protein K8U57_35935 [Planctomycetes bacterium]|nr:hypothetical protein [Planctomycetota bacterium]